jgi:hypothetical protein
MYLEVSCLIEQADSSREAMCVQQSSGARKKLFKFDDPLNPNCFIAGTRAGLFGSRDQDSGADTSL